MAFCYDKIQITCVDEPEQSTDLNRMKNVVPDEEKLTKVSSLPNETCSRIFFLLGSIHLILDIILYRPQCLLIFRWYRLER